MAAGRGAARAGARCFAELEPACTVRFVAFANEEPPFFMTPEQGSIVYAQAARQRGDDIRLMASLETMGCFQRRARQPALSAAVPPFLSRSGRFSRTGVGLPLA
jgi:hypothetical protein